MGNENEGISRVSSLESQRGGVFFSGTPMSRVTTGRGVFNDLAMHIANHYLFANYLNALFQPQSPQSNHASNQPIYHSLTLTHSLTHSLTITHSLSLTLTHSLTHSYSLSHSLTHYYSIIH